MGKTDLLNIPGVGVSIKEDFISLGYTNVESLKDANPEVLYEKLCEKTGTKIDRCVLYVFRCAVYYASTDNPNKEKLKWWDFKDE